MKSTIHEHPKKTYNNVSKKLFTFSAIIAASLIATTGYSQVYINAHVGFGFPHRVVYAQAPPPVVYQQPAPVYQEPAPIYQQPAPVYQQPYQAAPVYQDEYAPAPETVVYDNEFPGYAYYDYPAWNGHYRDQYYYAHYRPFFERDHATYFNRGRFDHERFEREHNNRGYANRGYASRGYSNHGSGNHGSNNRGYSDRGHSDRGHNDRGGEHRGR